VSWQGWAQTLVFFAAVLVVVKPLGAYVARVLEGERVLLDRPLGGLERLVYRLCGVAADRDAREMAWTTYALAMLLFNVAGVALVFALQRLQAHLPWNPDGMGAVSPDLSWNTAVSFVTNTNWQAYGGETTMSYFTQATALAVQNFVSASSGIAVMAALFRGLARKSTATLGNFWVDLVRSTLYVLLPLSIVLALVFVSQGVVQTFSGAHHVALLQATKDAAGNPVTEQVLAVGPVASQEAIKQLGTNGGGFFNANAAHPFENPTPLSNFLDMFGLLVLPAALTYTFGAMVKDTRQGWAVLAAMLAILLPLLWLCIAQEQSGTPALHALGVSGANLEGKEVRFGVPASGLYATITTGVSCGAVNAMHDSFTPLGGFVPLFLIQLGEIVFGGVGSGMYGMLTFAVVAVFVAGLMVGRTPEYVGKKIEAKEMKMASLAILVPCATILLFTALAVATEAGRKGASNPGPHGFTEILYAYSSATANNGSAFGGISANTPFFNVTLGLAMFLGRFFIKVPVLALAGSLARKKAVPVSAGTLPTHTPLFVAMLVGVILVVGALTFIPALALGPFVEHLLARDA
jgi:K+-transporting ATPase ATPase A chain